MSVRHGVTDVPCFEACCQQRQMNVETAERHWHSVHGDDFLGRYEA
jgi:hypothetical protein